MKYRTTAAYLSGAICGHLWMPNTLGGLPCNKSMRGPWGFMDVFSDPNGTTFAEALESLLRREGGDFQDARFTADTVLRVERRGPPADGQKGYTVHVWEREVSTLPDCADLVNADAYVADFLGED